MALDKPSAGGFAARVASRFFDGMTQRYVKDEQLGREKDLLAQRGEQTREAIKDRTASEVQMREMMEAFTLKRDAAQQAWKEGQAIEADKRDLEAAELLEGVKQKHRLEYEDRKTAGRLALQQEDEQSPAGQMRDLNTMYKDQLTLSEKRSVIKKKKEFGLDTNQAIGRVKGEYLAKDVLDDMKEDFPKWGKKPEEKFIRGDDLIAALSANGIPGEIIGLDMDRDYSAREVIVLLTSAQEDPMFFADDTDAFKNVIELISDLLEQSFDPGAEKKPEVGVGKAFTEAFGKLTRPATKKQSVNIPRLP
jgi:hypothetical protein